VALGAVMILSPLTVVAALLVAFTIALARRGLPPDEQRWVTILLVSMMAARALVVLALFVVSIPTHSAQNTGVLFGDEIYSLTRSLRARNVALGFPVSKLDYQVIYDSYARTRYMSWLSFLQVTFGPSSYAIRLINAVMFVGGAALLYRLARRRFGVAPALAALAAVLVLPSLFFWSISLLKESMYFLLTAFAIAGTVVGLETGPWRRRVGGAILMGASVWLLADLRPEALALTVGGLALGVVSRWLLQTRGRQLAAAVAAVAVVIAVAASASASTRLMAALTAAAKQHTGHVFTLGHSYKTLDDQFYANVETPTTSKLTLTPASAARYVARSAWSFVIVPLPWQVTTRSEMLFVPEQLAWYLLVVLVIVGLRPAWRRDPLLVSLLVGYVLPTAAVLALVNGNVGTLVRLRGLVTPFLVWVGALGGAVLMQDLIARRERIA
jgi:hypothetical protein